MQIGLSGEELLTSKLPCNDAVLFQTCLVIRTQENQIHLLHEVSWWAERLSDKLN